MLDFQNRYSPLWKSEWLSFHTGRIEKHRRKMYFGSENTEQYSSADYPLISSISYRCFKCYFHLSNWILSVWIGFSNNIFKMCMAFIIQESCTFETTRIRILSEYSLLLRSIYITTSRKIRKQPFLSIRNRAYSIKSACNVLWSVPNNTIHHSLYSRIFPLFFVAYSKSYV